VDGHRRHPLDRPVAAQRKVAESLGRFYASVYAAVVLVLLVTTDGIAVALGRRLRPLPRAGVWFAAVALTTLVIVVLVLLQMSDDRLTYV
jgi:hypothetical protein